MEKILRGWGVERSTSLLKVMQYKLLIFYLLLYIIIIILGIKNTEYKFYYSKREKLTLREKRYSKERVRQKKGVSNFQNVKEEKNFNNNNKNKVKGLCYSNKRHISILLEGARFVETNF